MATRGRCVWFVCRWCRAKIYVSPFDDVERIYFGHVTWCRTRHAKKEAKRW